MEDKKKVIIIGGGNHGIGNSVREAIALSKLENSDVQLIDFNPESKTIVEQLESLHINENILIEPIETFVQPKPKVINNRTNFTNNTNTIVVIC